MKYEAPWFGDPPCPVAAEYARCPSRYQLMLMPTGFTPVGVFASPCHWPDVPAATLVGAYPHPRHTWVGVQEESPVEVVDEVTLVVDVVEVVEVVADVVLEVLEVVVVLELVALVVLVEVVDVGDVDEEVPEVEVDA